MSFSSSHTLDQISRTLFAHTPVQIYAVPPSIPGQTGHRSTQWLKQPPMFEAKLVVVETSSTISTPAASAPNASARSGPVRSEGRPGHPPNPTPFPSYPVQRRAPLTTRTPPQPPQVRPISPSATRPTNRSPAASDSASREEAQETITISLTLLHPTTSELFANAPYTHPSTITPCTDSSRFFALRVVDPASGRKATLGMGFEGREGAFEFLDALKQAAKVLGWDVEQGSRGATGAGGAKEGVGRVVKGVVLPEVGRGEGKEEVELFAIAPPPPPAASSTATKAGREEGDDTGVDLDLDRDKDEVYTAADNDEVANGLGRDEDGDDDFGDFQ